MTKQIIYIIDDEEQLLELLIEYVQILGYQAIGYTDALKFFNENKSFADGAMMMLDLKMPVMDGIEVMRRMVETGNSLPLVLMSGYDTGVLHSAKQLAKAYSLDIIASLPKPIDFAAFKNIIQQYTKSEKRQGLRPELSVTANDLADAILNNQLVLHYQPQIEIKSGSLAGVEALVRWQHPEYGLIYPDAFISLAEESGLITDLTAQVIKLAVDQVLHWKSKDLMLQVSVNISADNITSLTLPEQLRNLLDNHKLDPAMLTLEVTESALMGELVTSLDILTRLRMKGINLSIDDFGTGYSSLSQLYRMPFTELKVDMSFVMNMTDDDDARGIVKTCITLGHELKMEVVAEGVENKETLDLLAGMGCDIAQGYYIARPMPADELIPWMNHRKNN